MSVKQDLSKLCTDIEELVAEFMHCEGRPGVYILFTLPPDYTTSNWVSNLGRADRINVLKAILEREIATGN